MSTTLFSPSWYRVAELKPRLRSHVEIHRHDYRGQVWYILQDHAGGRSHRLTPAAYRLVGLMNGERTVDSLWELSNELLGNDAPTQDEVIRLLGQLHAADALICDVPPDGEELFRRFRRHERMRWRQRLWTPLAIRIPLFDPDRFLNATLPCIGPLFGWVGAILWFTVVLAGAIAAGLHWSELTKNIVDRALTPQNLVLLWFVYPVVKAVHELGHGYATKKWGGEVHEIGIMFLVLVPVPYVDASAASGFRDKHKRITVGAIGIAVELFLGALAMFVWMSAEPGAVHAIAYNVMLISGVSTLLFNGNPLLRFDGYYVLSDILEIPNLGTRANAYLGYLAQRYLFGALDAESPARLAGERFWFVAYGLAAFTYRIFIMFAIILYIGGKFFAIGVALAIWATITQVIFPVGKAMSFLFSSPQLRRNRGRAVTIVSLLLAAVLALLFIVPAPLWTLVEGVTWPVEKSQVRSGADGFVAAIDVPGGGHVSAGQVLIHLEDPFLKSRVAVLKSRLHGLQRQLGAAEASDQVKVGIVRAEMSTVTADLARAQEKAGLLTIRSPRDGVLVLPEERRLRGRYIREGQLLAYVVRPGDEVTARAIVKQKDIGLVRERVRSVEVMAADWGAEPFQASIKSEVPGGTDQLPTAALGTVGGGAVATDPRDPHGQKTLERVFEFEIEIPKAARTGEIGQRVYVKFNHGYEPLGFQGYRAVRQLFLRLFSV